MLSSGGEERLLGKDNGGKDDLHSFIIQGNHTTVSCKSGRTQVEQPSINSFFTTTHCQIHRHHTAISDHIPPSPSPSLSLSPSPPSYCHIRSYPSLRKLEHSAALEKAITVYGQPENCTAACKRIMEVLIIVLSDQNSR